MDSDPTAGPDETLSADDGEGGVAMAIATDDPTAVEQIAALPAIADETDDEAAALAGLDTGGAAPATAAATRIVSGRYRSTGTPWRIELRVDVDGAHPTTRVSADYFQVSAAGAVTYHGSMRVDAPTVTKTPSLVTITGTAKYTFAASTPKVRIRIPRVPPSTPPAAATITHLTAGGSAGATYVAPFASTFMRSVLFEQDRQDTVPAIFTSYNTASLPSGGPARSLSVIGAYAEAGIQLQTAGTTDVVPTGEAGVGSSWSDPELHAAMVRHFSLWRNVPQWAVWLFHAQLHDLGPGLLGIMFDDTGKQRQGAAVFYTGLAGTSADQKRLQLYTCTHELGHCFNLLHSWQKSLATPPVPDRPGSFSWMNYPWRFPTGPASFWSGFGFQFDLQELVHIRHGFRSAVIPGGNPFVTGSALQEPESWSDQEADPGVKLSLSAPRSFRYGEPVSIDLELTATGEGERLVTARLRPRNGTVEIAIQGPSGNAVIYEPLLHQCVQDEIVALSQDTAPIREAAFIHYGRGGFYFDTPGRYRIRARTVTADGTAVLSNVLELRVRTPHSADDEDAADLTFGDEQGKLMYLVGSDFEELQAGNNALTELRERYPDHPLASVARIVQGTNAAREFKQVNADNSLAVREANPDEAAELLAPVLDVGAAQAVILPEMEADPNAVRKAVATQIGQTATEQAGQQLGAYLKARRREIAVELGGVTDSTSEPGLR